LVAEDAGEQAGDAIQDQGRCELASAEDKIADRKLFVGQVLGHALVYAFVAATNQEKFIVATQAPSRFLRKALALGREQDDALVWLALGPDAFHGVEDGRWFEQHALAAAERAIVDGTMTVMRPGAEVVDVDLEQAEFGGLGDDAILEGALEEVGEDGEDAEGHLVKVKQSVRRVHNDLFVLEIDLGANRGGEGNEQLAAGCGLHFEQRCAAGFLKIADHSE